jgi:hypothetical protein
MEMDEVIVYQSKLNELRFSLKEAEVDEAIYKIFEFVKDVKNSGMTTAYKNIFIKEAKNEIPIERLYKILKERELNPLFIASGAIGGKFLYDALKNASQAFFEKTKGEQFG